VDDIADDPERPGSRARPDLPGGVRIYHLASSRDRAASGYGVVKQPRHFIVYQVRGRRVRVVRVLHDATDLKRHL
jgi:toxin ParE1/3/4